MVKVKLEMVDTSDGGVKSYPDWELYTAIPYGSACARVILVLTKED